ncbi:MAG: hypothetical protein GXP42_14530 [Chloroflexi bacterium]|nr:hypothetical protein [Chloroflexota bacterium]
MSTTPAPTDNTWSRAWLDALMQFSQPGRMRRGQRFARRGKVKRFEIRPGEILAEVREGDQSYDVRIQLQVLPDETWEQIVERLSSQALYSARLLEGEMPPEVVQVFEDVGAPLFPRADELQASCTCPDWEVPCKHIAAIYYLLAERFDQDPFLLFQVRGRSKAQILAMLRALRQTQVEPENEEEAFVAPPLEAVLDTFWDIGPEIKSIVFDISPPAATLPQLRRLGPFPSTSLDLITLLAPIYETVSHRAQEWALQQIELQP